MAKASNKVIITCAVTGAIHTPTLSAGLPYTPADIARQAIDAAQAGAAILHLHAPNPQDGSPTGDPKVFAQFLPQIHAATDAVINLTTGGSPDMTPEQRLAAALCYQPEMCSLNMGSMNFAFHGIAAKISDWKFPWEKKYIEDSEAFIFRNTFRDVACLPPDGRLRYALRARMLRHRSSLQSGIFSRQGSGQTSALDPERLRDSRGHRSRPRQCDLHAPHGRSTVWQ